MEFDKIRCARCHHSHIFIEGGNYCSERMCMCSHYEPDGVDRVKIYSNAITGLDAAYEKIMYILKNIPETRELNNKEFVFLFWHFTAGYVVPPSIRRLLVDPESVRRAKQKIIEKNPELGPKEEGSLNLARLEKEWNVREWVTQK